MGLVPSQNYTRLSKYSILQCLHWQLNLSLMQTPSQVIYLKRINNEHGKLGAAAGFGFHTIKFGMKSSLFYGDKSSQVLYCYSVSYKKILQ